MKILQINFKFHMSKESFLALTEPAAEALAQVEGLHWKIWLLNEETQEGGGVYLFESVETAQAYLAGPLIGGLVRHPGLSDVNVRLSGYMAEPTRITRGPIPRVALATNGQQA